MVDDFRFEKINADSVKINGTEFKLEKGSEKYSDYDEEEKRWNVKIYFTVIHPQYTGPPMEQGMRPNSYLNDIYIAELIFSDGTSGKFKMGHYARSYDPFTKVDATKFRAIEVDPNTPISDKP